MTKIAATPISRAATPIATSTRGCVARSTNRRQRGCGASAARSIVIRSSAGRSCVTLVAAGTPAAGVPSAPGSAITVAPVISSSSVSALSSRRSLSVRFSSAYSGCVCMNARRRRTSRRWEKYSGNSNSTPSRAPSAMKPPTVSKISPTSIARR